MSSIADDVGQSRIHCGRGDVVGGVRAVARFEVERGEMGFVGATDTHLGTPAAVDEDAWAPYGDAGVRLRVLARLGQAPDHPTLLTAPESRYLKGLLLEAL